MPGCTIWLDYSKSWPDCKGVPTGKGYTCSLHCSKNNQDTQKAQEETKERKSILSHVETYLYPKTEGTGQNWKWWCYSRWWSCTLYTQQIQNQPQWYHHGREWHSQCQKNSTSSNQKELGIIRGEPDRYFERLSIDELKRKLMELHETWMEWHSKGAARKTEALESTALLQGMARSCYNFRTWTSCLSVLNIWHSFLLHSWRNENQGMQRTWCSHPSGDTRNSHSCKMKFLTWRPSKIQSDTKRMS